tara:strand:+ start:662 stop:856 length:195 start_codon:yes stop_codon:yes gene_type:complete
MKKKIEPITISLCCGRKACPDVIYDAEKSVVTITDDDGGSVALSTREALRLGSVLSTLVVEEEE